MSRAEIIGWSLIVVAPGIALNIFFEYRHELINVVKAITKSFIKPKKLKKIQPTIEVFGRNYKKISHTNKFDKVV